MSNGIGRFDYTTHQFIDEKPVLHEHHLQVTPPGYTPSRSVWLQIPVIWSQSQRVISRWSSDPILRQRAIDATGGRVIGAVSTIGPVVPGAPLQVTVSVWDEVAEGFIADRRVCFTVGWQDNRDGSRQAIPLYVLVSPGRSGSKVVQVL